MDVEKSTEKIHKTEHLHQMGHDMTLRTWSQLSNERSQKVATCRPCVKRLESKLCKKSSLLQKNVAFSQEKLSGGGGGIPPPPPKCGRTLNGCQMSTSMTCCMPLMNIHASGVASGRSCTMYALIATYVVILCSNVFMPYCFYDYLVGLILEHVACIM